MASASPRSRLQGAAARAVRGSLLRYVRAEPRASDLAGADRRVFILLWAADGMGGTIRAAFNLAEYLVERDYEVEIVSGIRDRDTPFFGAFPRGVRVTTLDDRRASAEPAGVMRLVRRALRGRRSVVMESADRASTSFSLWTDLRLARALRRRAGFLIATRPGLNLMTARLAIPGLTTIGLEQMNLSKRSRELRRAMKRLYPRLDALVALTETDVRAYHELLNGQLRLFCIPNTVRQLPGPKADMAATTVFTAGRYRDQKGFDLLIHAYAAVAARHPEWRLRIRGTGHRRKRLEALIDELELGEVVTLEGPAQDIGADMAEASVFVLSSRFEGFPLTLLEALSKGMAVISFDCPTGPADILEDHRNGILVPPKDVEALARAMLEMIDDVQLRRRCSEAAVETAQRYTIEAIGPQWERLLRRLS